MKNIAVTYQSHYGTTKRYAQWIAEALKADLFDSQQLTEAQLANYDLIIHGGGLYASSILGTKMLRQYPNQRYLLFTVGLANPETTDYSKILAQNLPATSRKPVKVFHFRGGINYQKLTKRHLLLMKLMKKMSIDHKQPEELTAEDEAFLASYGGQVDFCDRKSITPLLEFVQQDYA